MYTYKTKHVIIIIHILWSTGYRDEETLNTPFLLYRKL